MSFYLCHTNHISNDSLCGCEQTQYYLIINVILCHTCHIRKDNICGTEQILCEFICNAVQLE